jgi:hypothetical protein
MLYKRLNYERDKNNNHESWWFMLPKIMLVYNNYKIHSTIKMTPKEARKPEHIDNVSANLEAKRVTNREYPNIEVNDKVRIMRKKKNFEKEYIPIWSKIIYEVENIIEDNGHKFYKIKGKEIPLMRHEILWISN